MSKPQQIKRQMSNAFASSSYSQLSSNSIYQLKDVARTLSIVDSQDSKPSTQPPHTESPARRASSYPNTHQPTYNATSTKKTLKLKQRTAEEQEIVRTTHARFASRLASDHLAALYPDTDSPFSATIDVVNRLLPYHVFQHPKNDLELLTTTGKGKGKATEDHGKREIKETKFAIECFKRRKALQERFREVKFRSGKRSAPDDQTFVLAQAVLDADRAEAALLNSELRAARAELERIEKEKRASASHAMPVFYSAAPPALPSMPTQYYRGYPYAYTQAYGAPGQSTSTSTFSVSSPSFNTNYAPQPSSGPIPVQLPVASLPALHALGIVPVPTTALPPEGHPQPPAVLRGSTSNGTMLSLEINVSLLQSAQMNGLAIILNTLMSRSSPGGPTGYSLNSSPGTPNGTNAGTAS